ncbi:MAG: Nicotinamidase-related amidase [Modestobacter sp.]|jgi:nicotinamidase-related amidase|nr:Nicotinamidase-related amidase [Modestobacter sp.]
MELDPRTTALMAVHLQNDVVGADGAFADFFHEQVVARNVVAVNADLIAAARAAGVPVIYTRVAWKPDYSDLHANSPLLGMVAQFGCLKDGSPSAEIVAEVAPTEGDHVVTHQRVGPFVDSALPGLLKELGISTLVISGVATNASVEASVRGASDHGYRTIVVEDGCSAGTLEAHQASIGSMGLLAEISTAAEVTQALGATEAATA